MLIAITFIIIKKARCHLFLLCYISNIIFNGTTAANGIDVENSNVILNGGTLYVNSGYSADGYGSVVFVRSGAVFTMNGEKLVANHEIHGYGSLAIWMFNGNTKFIMNGGEIEKTAGIMGAVMASGSGSSGTTIEINGGSIKSNTVAIYHPQSGSLKINGGYIEGTTAVYIKCGTIEINGGEMKATLTTKDNYKYASGSCYPTGDAVVIDACGYPDKNPVVSITGGTFTVTAKEAHGIAHYKYNGYTAIITNTTSNTIYEESVSA